MKKLSEKELSTLKEYQEQKQNMLADLGNIELNISCLKNKKKLY